MSDGFTITRRGTTVSFKWNASAGVAIQHRLYAGVFRAINIYRFALKRKLNFWGSIFISSVKRMMWITSAPGSPPKKQTGNLEKSIEIDIEHNGVSGFFGQEVNGYISTDVPYAKTLELGGSLQVDQSTKKYTRVRLVNPVKDVHNIAARPAWLPTFEEEKSRMIQTIRRG